MRAFIRAFLLLGAVAVAGGGLVAYGIVSRGLSTRVPPTAVEEAIAAAMRSMATPWEVRQAKNPVDLSEQVREEGLAHFADHCATCHGNDGRGDTELGRSFYPPAPDMRAANTQARSDGELFWIIENGIRLTGMPAWGTGTEAGQRASWALVHFIRRLPSLTAEEIERMETMNPRTPEEFRQQEAARRFLAGEEPAATPQPSALHRHQ
jgi:mono/diheme cytochrome c family protein